MLGRDLNVPLMMQEVAFILRGSKNLPDLLQDHLVRILNDLDYKGLRSDNNDAQKQALASIEQLVHIIGNNLIPFAPKFVALLSFSVEIPNLQEQALSAWTAFIKELVAVAPHVLKSMATLIAASLVPLFDGLDGPMGLKHVSSLVNLLDLLFVENFSLLESSLAEMPLLPDLPSLSHINKNIKESERATGLKGPLKSLTSMLGHESLKVRLSVAARVERLLESRRDELMEMHTSELAADRGAIQQLVGALLRGMIEELKSKDAQNLRLLCARCLGIIGAIDPFRLQLELQKSEEDGWSDEDLVCKLISSYLSKILRGAVQAHIQDAAAVTIQELLKLCGCRGDLLQQDEHSQPGTDGQEMSTTSGRMLWESMSSDMKNVICPCLKSKLVLKVQNSGKESSATTVYHRGLSVRRWISNWLHKIISKRDTLRSQVFNLCKPVLRDDVATCMYILPRVVLDAICEGSNELRAQILEEILAVLLDGTDAVGAHATMDPASSGKQDSDGNVCKQAVFSLLDWLTLWISEASQMKSYIQQALASGKTSGLNQEGSRVLAWLGRGFAVSKSIGKTLGSYIEKVASVLDAIPKETLSHSSFQCHAFARALQYYETLVRDKSGCLNPASGKTPGHFQDADVSFLLKAYRELDEPDGLIGLTKLRSAPSLADHVLVCETSGNWTEALAYYEQALQTDTLSVADSQGMLNCLLNMGNLQAALMQVNGLRAEQEQNSGLWSLMGTQAAWRLGQWDTLNDLVDDVSSSSKLESTLLMGAPTLDFNLGLSKLLIHLHENDMVHFQAELKRCRIAQLAPPWSRCHGVLHPSVSITSQASSSSRC